MSPGVDPGWHQLSVVASLDLLAPVTHTHREGEAISQSPPSPYSPCQELSCASSSSILEGLCLCPKGTSWTKCDDFAGCILIIDLHIYWYKYVGPSARACGGRGKIQSQALNHPSSWAAPQSVFEALSHGLAGLLAVPCVHFIECKWSETASATSQFGNETYWRFMSCLGSQHN